MPDVRLSRARIGINGGKIVVFTHVGAANIETIFIDLSGVAGIDSPVLQHLLNMNGLGIMGCKTVVTGLLPNIVKIMIHSSISFETGP